MGLKPLTTRQLSKNNLRSNPFRTVCLVMVVAVLSFTMYGGAILSQSLKNGLYSLKNRLGADLAVVPLEHESQYEGIILSGEPSRFYFDRSMEQQIKEIQGVEEVSPQLYLSTLSAACCSVPVQVIGFDPDSDFVIKPWITKVYGRKLETGQLIAGSDIVINDSRTLKFFNDTYPVAAQLEKTSTGMDYSIYANMDTMRMLLEGAKKTGMNLSVNVYGTDIDQSISTVLVKLKKGYDVDTVTTNIRRQVSGISIVKSKNMFLSAANQISVLITFVNTVACALWIIAVFVLAVMFTVIMNGRKKEFALLRSLGAARVKLCKIVLTESLMISILGGVLGAFLASLVVFPFSTYIGESLHLPYLLPDLMSSIRLLAGNLVLAIAAGPLAAIYSAGKVSRTETCVLIREGE
ncbi:putative ABC transport system permease protein [Lacrimispora xylanisolvens]|uniref:Putative hemin transport system permease protein HrtB n=1 Tax=Lacrimispora xylanisolvens TaxID=384636 RepID=A0A2S6HPI1_9FIRM|nr:ABC transporter permease [Hungatella xylanolytica]MBE5987330.1 ABC transporter permease [Paenibacillaceae bacterium]PPK79434.1 putative ABC transport system permease protein [Hungatella xylanolytica]